VVALPDPHLAGEGCVRLPEALRHSKAGGTHWHVGQCRGRPGGRGRPEASACRWTLPVVSIVHGTHCCARHKAAADTWRHHHREKSASSSSISIRAALQQALQHASHTACGMHTPLVLRTLARWPEAWASRPRGPWRPAMHAWPWAPLWWGARGAGSKWRRPGWWRPAVALAHGRACLPWCCCPHVIV
jgi:hypothetical protein